MNDEMMEPIDSVSINGESDETSLRAALREKLSGFQRDESITSFESTREAEEVAGGLLKWKAIKVNSSLTVHAARIPWMETTAVVGG